MSNSPSFKFLEDFRKIKNRNGSIFGTIEYERPSKKAKSNQSIFKTENDNIGIELYHWKTANEKYYTQWIVLEGRKLEEALGQPYLSPIPMYEEDTNRDAQLKEIISTEFSDLDINNVNIFLSEINFLLNNYEHVKNRLYWKNSVKSNKPKGKVEIPLLYPTSHLKCFDELMSLTRLIGDEYIPILKTVWYNLLSILNATNELEIGDVSTDGRIHLIIFLKSGSGKSEIKRAIKNVLEGIEKSFIEPTSFHPEQFVGKVRIEKDQDGNRSYREIRGHLSLDYVLIDEGKSLLTSNDAHYTESRRYLRLALDPYPNNEITKKSVDIEHEHSLKYKPTCCVSIFLQPYKISQEIVLDGDFRRFVVPYVSIADVNKEQIYRDRVRNKQNIKKHHKALIEFISSLNKIENYIIQEESIKIFENISLILIKKGEHRSPIVKNFMNITGFTIQNILLKFSAVQALQDNTDIIEPKHIELAFVDYAELLEHTYDFIENKILGSLDYGENWSGAVDKDQTILKWLYNKGATSKDNSKISIKDYKEKIMEIYKVAERQARRIKKEHEEKDWIESKTIQHTSKIWLTFEPEDKTLDAVSKDIVDKDFREKYMEIVNKYNLI